MREFGLTVEEHTVGVFRLALRGELSLEHAYVFDEELRLVEERRPTCVMIDLRELRFLDSSGLSRLLAARRRARRGGHRFLLIRGPRTVQRLFSLTGVNEAFDTVNDVPAGLARHAEASA
jgi:anti-sigma B factor antagonist